MALAVSDHIDTPERLREILPRWTGNASKKDHDRINEVAAAFIARSPYILISSAGRDGTQSISPKGDAPGFVTVHDDRTLIVPDRLGNHRLDTFENLMSDPRVGLIFLVPGHTETLRVAGTARIARDEALRAPFAIRGKLPDLVLVVDVAQVFMHCSKSTVRARLWTPEAWPERGAAPSLAEWVKSTVETDETLEEVQGNHDRDRETRLY